MLDIYTFWKKLHVVLVLVLVTSGAAYAQNVGINASGATPDASAGLDVNFTDKGILIPRVALTSSTDVSTISSPATSLLMYNTATAGIAPNNVTPGYYYYNGSSWVRVGSAWTNNSSNLSYTSGNVGIGVDSPTYKLQIGAASNPLFISGIQNGSTADSVLTISSGVVKKLPQNGLLTSAWGLTGNSTANTNFLGTTNNQSLRIRTNNIQRFYIDSLGSVAIGASPTFNTTARERFLIDLGTAAVSASTGYNAMVVRGNINNYLQFNLQNKSSGTDASADVVITANDGSETDKYIDLGINNSGNTKNYFGSPRDGYLYTMGGNLNLGTASSSKNINFYTAGGATSNRRMIITSSGLVGIGTDNPLARLDIRTSSNPLYLSGLQTGTTDTLLAFSSGYVRKNANTMWSMSGNSVAAEQKLGTITNFALPFITNNAERMRITGDGIVGIATNNPDTDVKLHVNGDARATSWQTSSDRRLKKNIKPLQYGLSTIMSLQPVSYNWIDSTLNPTTQLGLIAQDTKKVIPEIVAGNEEKEKLSINYTELIPVLINAIKEQQNKIDSQQKEIDELKQLLKK